MRRFLLILAALLLVPFVAPALIWSVVFEGIAPTMAALSTPVTAKEKHAECLRLNREPPDYGFLDRDEWLHQIERWADICRDAHAADNTDAAITLSFGRVLMAQGERAQALPLFKTVAAQDNPVALKEIFEFYKSWDRDLAKPRLVTRAEAEAALRRAAELGDADAILMLTVRLDRGTLVKRNAEEARLWAARGAANPPKDWGRGFMQSLQARLLSKSDKDEERARGLWMLNELIKVGQYDAKTHLANAIRTEDPVRARRLLEEAMRGDSGGALPPLADMLIKGEGGPADPKRAVEMLKTKAQDVPGVRAAYGQLLLEGKLVPRDVREGINRVAHGGVFNYDLKIQTAYLLAQNPDVPYSHPRDFLFDMAEFVELGEPGALEAMVALKLSAHPQFADRAGGCALIEETQKRGDTRFAAQATGCRAT